MSVVTYPVGLLVDDGGAILTAPVVTIVSVLNKAGVAVASPGAVVNGSGTATPISVDYDAEAHGEAWITLAVSQGGSTVTKGNATKAMYVNPDRSRIAMLLGGLFDADVTINPDGLTGLLSVYGFGASHNSGTPLLTAALARASATVPFSIDRN